LTLTPRRRQTAPPGWFWLFCFFSWILVLISIVRSMAAHCDNHMAELLRFGNKHPPFVTILKSGGVNGPINTLL
jgi:hypothetical protein